jgi:hypothetical protein
VNCQRPVGAHISNDWKWLEGALDITKVTSLFPNTNTAFIRPRLTSFCFIFSPLSFLLSHDHGPSPHHEHVFSPAHEHDHERLKPTPRSRQFSPLHDHGTAIFAMRLGLFYMRTGGRRRVSNYETWVRTRRCFGRRPGQRSQSDSPEKPIRSPSTRSGRTESELKSFNKISVHAEPVEAFFGFSAESQSLQSLG